MRGIDLFCGCGGMSLGFQNAGIQIVAAVDHWETALTVYRGNFKHPTITLDLNDVQKSVEQLRLYQAEVIIGGPPCQDFSEAGKRNEELGRANLTVSFAEIVSAMRPAYFVMENVALTLKSKRYQIARQIFKAAHYGLTEQIIEASLCNVPQQRKRLFVIGELDGRDNALKPLLESGLTTRPTTVREYFGDNLGFEYYYRHPRTYARRAIYGVDEPSPTIRGVNRPIPPNYRPHPQDAALPEQAIVLTTLQRSYLQTFPAHFSFSGPKSHLEQMIGNAVPVKLAEFVAHKLLQYQQESFGILNLRK